MPGRASSQLPNEFRSAGHNRLGLERRLNSTGETMPFDFDVIIVGSGFGATVLAIDQTSKGKRVLILERGVWWLTPELTGENPMNPFLKARPETQPVQYWPRPDHRRGLVDFLAIVKANGPLGD